MTGMSDTMNALFILYVADQDAATAFYTTVLDTSPRLHVPGMTEFDLGRDAVLGLMPAAGIRRLLGEGLPDPMAAAGIPRAELYLLVNDAQAYLDRALNAGARLLSPLQLRDWGDHAAYVLDLDSHVLAFAEKAK
jgi:catechol 2,3-dioxygenase-like lactoylglutathione lyase family enzyme